MPIDEPTAEGDSTGSEDKRQAGTAASDQTPSEAAAPGAPVPEAPWPPPSNGEVRSERTEQRRADTESGSRAGDSGPAERDTPPPSSDDFWEGLLAGFRKRDPQNNIDTRPPDAETITFRSVIIAEIYAGKAADSLITALEAIDWFNFDEPLLGRIAEARKGGPYSSGTFPLVSERPPPSFPDRYGLTDLPSGIARIYCEYYAIGQSIMAMVLTFVLDADEAKRIDRVAREDAESRLDGHRVRTVSAIKSERIRDVREDVVGRCRAWLKDRMPGTLSASNEELSPPAWPLISLATGKPCANKDEYMNLLDLGLWFPALVETFVGDDFLFLVHPRGGLWEGELVAAFNEADAVRGGWPADLLRAPELFHQRIASLMVANGLDASLHWFERRLREVRAELNGLDINQPVGTRVIRLRSRLLELSREVTTVSSEATTSVDYSEMIWGDFWPLARLNLPGDTTAYPQITADTKRQQLRATVASLEAQEAELRDLILVVSQSMSETRNLELQTQVLGLTNSLNGLTKWLIILTIVLVALGVATLVVQL